MRLVSVYDVPEAVQILFDLLKERTPQQSISHKKMPTLAEHKAFVESRPYVAWYLVEHRNKYIGAAYLTHQREIGIFMFRGCHKRGYGKWAVNEMKRLHPGRMLANINPENEASIRFFENLGGKRIQATYEL